jgi:hypothetical protein
MPLPTFVIAGAQKCGTSSLSATLRRHPEIFMAKPKELHFFDWHFDRGVSWYEEQFSPAAQHRQLGEATPSYLYSAEARTRIAETLPDTRLVAILRDPVKRAYSHYWHTRRRGQEDQPFEKALDLEPQRLAEGTRGQRSRFSYTDRGHYIDQLTDLASRHGRSLLHVMLLEDLISERVPTLERLLEFLGGDVAPLAEIEEIHTNRGRVLNEKPARRVVASYPPMEPETQKRLSEQFQASTKRLADWLGRDLSVWSSG